MPNLMANATNFPRRINMYVPAMAYSADVNYNGETRVNFGAPAAANATLFATSLVVPASATFTYDLSSAPVIADPFGRTLAFSGTGTGAFSVYGWDYLGQPMVEAIVFNTTAIGKKAFKSLNYFLNSGGAALTLSIGTDVKLGLPYKAIRAVYEINNGVLAAAGTLVAPNLADPQAAGNSDPRGVYTTTTTMNGANIISAVFNMANDVNTANNGGLHGVRHAAA